LFPTASPWNGKGPAEAWREHGACRRGETSEGPKNDGARSSILKKNTHGPFKVTLPAPSNFMLASYKAGITDKFYPTHADLLKDLVEIVRDDVKWLVSEGVQYIQFDAPFYSPLPRSVTNERA